MDTLADLSELSFLADAATANHESRLLTVKIDEIVSKEQIRVRFRYIEELAESIKSDGLQSPIIVSPKNEKGKYTIQKGERRWRACKEAGLEKVEVLVRPKPENIAEEIVGELIENIQRDNLSPIEVGNALKTLADEGLLKKDIAKKIGKSNSYVSDHISLLGLADSIRELAESGTCEDTRTLNNLRKLHDLDAEYCDNICTVALAEGESITRKQSAEMLQQAKDRLNPKIDKKEVDKVDGDLLAPQDHETKEEVKLPYPEPQRQQVPEFDLDAYEDPKPDEDDYVGEDDESENKEKSSKDKPKKVKPTDSEDGDSETKEGSGPDREWQTCSPTEVMIHVNVMYGDDIENGILLLNRVSSKTDMVWVKIIKTDKKKDKIVQVHASDIEVKALSV